MSISLKQYLELPLDAVVSMNKETFVVSRFVDEMELREPVLMNRQTGERLHGAIYITHLLNMVSMPSRPSVSEKSVQIINATEDNTPNAIGSAACSVLHEAFYCPEVLTGRLEHASRDEYFKEFYELMEGESV